MSGIDSIVRTAYSLITALSPGTVLRLQGEFAEAIDILTSVEEPVRTVFTGGNAHRLATLLITN